MYEYVSMRLLNASLYYCKIIESVLKCGWLDLWGHEHIKCGQLKAARSDLVSSAVREEETLPHFS